MREQEKGLHFDPRTKLFILLIYGVYIFFVGETGLLIFLGLAAVYLFAQGLFIKTLKYLAGFGVLYGLQFVFITYLTGAAAIFGVIVFFIMRFIPVMMVASALSAAPSGELIAALQKLCIPKAVIVPLAVGLRFMPCIAREYAVIRDAMRLRGIALASRSTLSHPVMTLECILVPLLMRSMKISDELAASVSTRGIDNPQPRTCLRQLHFGLLDGIVLVSFITAGILLIMFFR